MRFRPTRWSVLLILAAFGCERPAEKAAEQVAESLIAGQGRESKVEIDRERGSVVVRLGAAIRPKRWPADVPFYAQARRAKASRPDEGKQRLTLAGSDDLEQVARFYRERLAAEGWTVEERKGALVARKSGREIVARFEKRIDGGRTVLEVSGVGA